MQYHCPVAPFAASLTSWELSCQVGRGLTRQGAWGQTETHRGGKGTGSGALSQVCLSGISNKQCVNVSCQRPLLMHLPRLHTTHTHSPRNCDPEGGNETGEHSTHRHRRTVSRHVQEQQRHMNAHGVKHCAAADTHWLRMHVLATQHWKPG
jgi:hypothetical protein